MCYPSTESAFGGSWTMPYYRLYCINDAGRFMHCEDFSAPGDEAAVQRASELRGAAAAELWSGVQLIKSFEKHRRKITTFSSDHSPGAAATDSDRDSPPMFFR
jgi:hypothetical protein